MSVHVCALRCTLASVKCVYVDSEESVSVSLILPLQTIGRGTPVSWGSLPFKTRSRSKSMAMRQDVWVCESEPQEMLRTRMRCMCMSRRSGLEIIVELEVEVDAQAPSPRCTHPASREWAHTPTNRSPRFGPRTGGCLTEARGTVGTKCSAVRAEAVPAREKTTPRATSTPSFPVPSSLSSLLLQSNSNHHSHIDSSTPCHVDSVTPHFYTPQGRRAA